MSCYFIVALRIEQRVQTAALVQEVLTRFGCNIKTRLGLHDVGGGACANDGIVILQACGEKSEIEQMLGALNAVPGVKAKLIDLS